MGDWVPIFALLTAMVAVAVAVFTKSPLASASLVASLRKTIADLRDEIAAQNTKIMTLEARLASSEKENRRLRERVDALLEDSDYWRKKYQEEDRKRSRGDGSH